MPSTTNYVLRVQTLIVLCLFLQQTHLPSKSGLRPHTRQIHGSVPEKLWETSVLRKLQRVDRCVHPKFGDARHKISLVLAVCLRGHDKYLLIIARNCEEDAMVHNQHSRHIVIVYIINNH